MIEEILHVLIEGLKLLPFLFLSYLIIELIEHKSSKKMEEKLKKSGVFGPIIGSILGLVPQCGFSVTASNLYAGRVITIGTLIAVFLSTSDEAIPIFVSHPESIGKLLPLLLIKFIVALVIGIVIDFIYRKKHTLKEEVEELDEHIHDMCSHCHCSDKNILVSSIKHTLSVFLFILIVLYVLHIAIHLVGEDNLSKILMQGSVFQPFIASLIGLIPNCASSVLLTELYLAGTISFGSILAGLLTGAGIGIAVLFRINKPQKDNFKILGIVYGVGVITGLITQFIQFLF
jgi:hypothetical protein